VLLEESLYVFGEGGVVVDFIVRGFAVVSRVDGVYRTLEGACDCTGSIMSVRITKQYSREVSILCNTLIVPFTPKQAMHHHNWISISLARVIVKPIREVDDSQACRRVE
jgi:hypothetical protein